jgi:hypothetical protein
MDESFTYALAAWPGTRNACIKYRRRTVAELCRCKGSRYGKRETQLIVVIN